VLQPEFLEPSYLPEPAVGWSELRQTFAPGPERVRAGGGADIVKCITLRSCERRWTAGYGKLQRFNFASRWCILRQLLAAKSKTSDRCNGLAALCTVLRRRKLQHFRFTEELFF